LNHRGKNLTAKRAPEKKFSRVKFLTRIEHGFFYAKVQNTSKFVDSFSEKNRKRSQTAGEKLSPTFQTMF